MRRHRSTGIYLIEQRKQSPVPPTKAGLRVIQLLVGMLLRGVSVLIDVGAT